MAEILHHFWLEGISPHPLNLNIGGIQIQETVAVVNGRNPAPPSMSSQHWNSGVEGGSIKGAIMQYMAGGAGFQPSTVVPFCLRPYLLRGGDALRFAW